MALKDGWEQLDSDKPSLFGEWVNHFSQKLPGPELTLTATLRERYPDHAIVSTTGPVNFFSFPGVRISPLPGLEPPVAHVVYRAPARRGDGPGRLAQDIQFATFRLEWRNEVFTLIVAEWREVYSTRTYTAVLRRGGAEVEPLINTLIIAASAYHQELREEILIFNDGWWQKDHALWVEVQKANWNDVILDDELKTLVQSDVDNFFKSEKIFKDLAVPWKRGIIMYGPPGNGKTISTKALMKTTGVPSLYVKSFVSYGGPEKAIRDIFKKAREMAPCLLILEDLDSLINDQNRSFFLNELDGLESNDGILLIGSTNHLDRLDPGLANRPSRFDRKFAFNDPTMSERILYCQYWKKKLASNKSIAFSKALVEHIASITDGFSFAYLKEAFVSSLVSLAVGAESDPFAEVIERQIKALKKELEGSTRIPTFLSRSSSSDSSPIMGIDRPTRLIFDPAY